MTRARRLMSLAELRRRYAEPELAVIDVRPLSRYNGWRLNEGSRGGHISGATALPGSWLSILEDDDLELLLHSKGIVPENEVVLYGDRVEEVSAVEARLRELGHQVRVSKENWASLAASVRLPVERLSNYEKLVHPAWLRHVLAGGRPEAPPKRRLALFHVNFGVPEEYEENHIPHASYLDTNWLENPVDWNRRTPEELEAAMRALGLTVDTTVVLYGRDTEGEADEKWPGRRAGQIAAARAALILRYCGVEDVRLLDGGYDCWVREGNPLETIERTPTPGGPSFGTAIPRHPELIVDIEDAKEILSDPEHAALVSVRTWNEHIGKVSGYNYIGPAGRIAGDVWGNCGSDAYHMQHYRNVDNTMRPYPEIAANWETAGISADKWVAFYCGTGWRASETWFCAYLMGWQRVAVYDGGWFEWSKDPLNNPIDSGAPPEELAA